MTAPLKTKLKAKPLMRYHGGKWQLSKWIISHFPEHKTYVEPYGGAGSVLLKKPRSYAEVYNDIDAEIVNVFAVLRDPELSERLHDMVTLTPFARTEYDRARQSSHDPVEQARRTLAKSYMGFGSNSIHKPTGFRRNTSRPSSIPAHDWMRWPERVDFFKERLRGVVLENRDATKVMQSHDRPDTLHYVDPPYLPSTRGAGQDYAYEMSEAEHLSLLSTLCKLQGFVVLSGYVSDIYTENLPGWHCVRRKAYASGARPRLECLFIKPAKAAPLPLFTGEKS